MPRPVNLSGCTVRGCTGRFYARGFCGFHWRRWRKYGDAETVVAPAVGRDQNSDPRNMSGEARAEFGAIVSFAGEEGARLTVHRPGLVAVAIGEACAYALEQDDTLRITAISTPATTYTDLLGSRANRRDNRQGTSTVELPERSRIVPPSYRWMLHPSLKAEFR